MISLDRTSVVKPAILDEPYKSGKWKGKTERQRAIAYFEQKGTMKGFKFERYSDRSVKDALGALSHNKCAYCESYIGATQPVEVEHYRPKGIVLVNDATGDLEERYGYYWLGSDWNNLLPSCIDCNRERYHEDDDEVLILGGKKNLFPVEAEHRRAKQPGDEIEEDNYRLLLDPTRDEPEKYLEFNEEGIVKVASTTDEVDIKKGRTTIDVYALWRPGLSKCRKEVCLKILDNINNVSRDLEQLRNIIKLMNDDPDNEILIKMKDLALKGLESHLNELHQYQETQKPYAGMTRQIIKKHLPELDG